MTLRLVEKYVEFVRTFRFLIIAFWVIAMGLGGWQALNFLGNTKLTLEVPSGSQAALGQNLLSQYFWFPANANTYVLVLHRTNGSSVLGADTAFATFALAEWCETQLGSPSTGVIGYYTVENSPLAQYKDLYVSANGEWSYIFISSVYDTKYVDRMIKGVLESQVAAMFPDGSMDIVMYSNQVFSDAMQSGTEHDMLVMDGSALPVALAILALTLRSLRLIIIPLIAMLMTLTSSFLIMYPISNAMTVVSFAPSLMMSVTIAMSIDYSLFLLSRFIEEIKVGKKSTQHAVVGMLHGAGHTVLVSGCTLAACFVGLVLFPISILRSMGLGCAIAVLLAVLINLTFTPAFILSFPVFFANAAHPCKSALCASKRDELEEERMPIISDTISYSESDDKSIGQGSNEQGIRTSKWYPFSQFIVGHPWLPLVVISGLAICLALHAVSFKRSLTTMDLVPRLAEATEAYKNMQKYFGPGISDPYFLVIADQTEFPREIYSNDTFQLINDELLSPLAGLACSPLTSFLGPSIAQGDSVPLNTTCLATCGSNCNNCDPDCAMSCLLSSMFANPGDNAIFYQVTLTCDPFLPEGIEWLSSVRDYYTSFAQQQNLTIGMTKSASDMIDTVAHVYASLPVAVGVTMAIVFAFVGLAFRSIIVPIRSIFTIAITLAYVYGAAAYVYQDEILNPLGFWGLTGRGGVCWIPPVLNFSILVGLGLDYDIFLLGRIFEYRLQGRSEKDSIIHGLVKTGPIITAAGAIMAIAFLGLLFTGEAVLNQISFYLVFAVLLDTLCIRTMLVPSCMSLLGATNWWPRKMPAVE
eukprot:m.330212 g.330212  ORF g.330212 m.330212 type:complete len:811 (-) comp55607_c1_seq3:155-2587(-)